MKRTSLWALGAFVALLAVYLGTRETTVSAGTKKLDLTSQIDPGKVIGLEANGVSLKKQGTEWTVAGKPADAQLVQSALEALAKVKTSEVVTERPEKHAEYEVDSTKALKVKVEREGGPPVELWVGKSARSGGAYVRKPGEDAVFVAPGALTWQLRRDANAWRKKRFVSFKAEEVSELAEKPAGEGAYTLQRDGVSWKLAEGVQPPPGFRFDANAAASVVSQLANLSAQDFADHASDEVLGLSGAHHVVEAKLASGKTVALHFGPQPDPADQTAAQELRNQFDAVDGAGTKDDRITPDELEKIANDASKPESLRKVAQRLKGDAAAFARLDVGVYAATPQDGALTRGDLDAAARTASLVPVRMDGDPQVYLVPSWAAAAATKKLGELRDLSLFNFDPQKVSKVEIRSGSSQVVVVKEGEGWKIAEPKTLPAGFEFDPSVVPMQLASFKAMRALRLAEGPALSDAQAGLAQPAASLEVTVEGGATQRLRLGKAVDGGLYAKGAVDDALYLVSTAEKSRLDQGVQLFKKRPAPSFAGNGLDQLPPEVRAKLEASLRQHANGQ